MTVSLCQQMQESFSRSSVSCLINANLNSDPKEGKKSDPCWQVTQQLHHHIEKVFHFISQLNINPVFVCVLSCVILLKTQLATLYCSAYNLVAFSESEIHVLHWDSGSGKMMQLHITFREH